MTLTNISEIAATWPVKDGWKIAPAGLAWIAEGSRIQLGVNCLLDTWCRLGDECVLGNWCRLGDSCRLGDECRLGNSCRLGDECVLDTWCRLGNSCRLGDECVLDTGCRLGDGCVLDKGAADPIDLGFTDGYRKVIAQVQGVAYIGAGCRWFTLEEAQEHWQHRGDRALTRCALEAAKAIATAKGWKTQ